jgi:hypothetical protein
MGVGQWIACATGCAARLLPIFALGEEAWGWRGRSDEYRGILDSSCHESQLEQRSEPAYSCSSPSRSMLLNDECSPTTDEIGFIDLPVGKAADIIVKKWQKTVPLRASEHQGTLKENLSRLLPLTTHARPRRMFLQTNSRWTAYFDNGWRGTDAWGVIGNLAEKRALGMKVAADPQSFGGVRRPVDSPSVIWEVFGPKPTEFLNVVRKVSVIDEGVGDWEFDQVGQPFPFEDLARYSARRIRDRFTVEMLLEYLKHFDIDLFNADFYCGPAVLIELTAPNQQGKIEFATFKDARETRHLPGSGRPVGAS